MPRLFIIESRPVAVNFVVIAVVVEGVALVDLYCSVS